MIYIFKRNKTHYIVPAESVEDAWKQLQKRLSWSIEIVKAQCKFIHSISDMSNAVLTLK